MMQRYRKNFSVVGKSWLPTNLIEIKVSPAIIDDNNRFETVVIRRHLRSWTSQKSKHRCHSIQCHWLWNYLWRYFMQNAVRVLCNDLRCAIVRHICCFCYHFLFCWHSIVLRSRHLLLSDGHMHNQRRIQYNECVIVKFSYPEIVVFYC